ncbi:hypothetical protein [uncultured Pseudacidovorax sp.]|uniref:hypothetical protein n=1 Tax=uncultured Pseudacidovorax sp. TaxID=679313 RepID=UPI0025F6B1DD|nr:hypothetical protein [uncultured Pseudacidovorax sp.]
MVEVQIWRGHYVTPEHTYVPGETARVDADEAAFLRERGFVKPDDYKPPEETQDGSVKVTAREGVNVIGLA